MMGCNNGRFQARNGYVKWDNHLLHNLAKASEMTEEDLKLSVKSLAAALGIKLPRWSDNPTEVKK